MSDNAYRRNVNRGDSSPQSGYDEDYYRSQSARGQKSSARSQGSPTISFKTIKNTSLSCAKSLTNKMIAMTSSGIQAASTAINNYKETAAANARKAALANPYSFLRIAERISTTNDPVASHRELVAVMEHLLIWQNPPIQLNLERDRFGQPTTESMRSIRLINEFLLGKVLTYVQGRRDCCLFIIKFATWRMRTTHIAEEILLSLELLQRCMESYGSFFLSLMTRSCMRRLRKLLRMNKITTSLAGGVKKQITKFLVGSSNVHPGVPTDVRIHVIKAKVLYMVQLWHDVFMLDQGLFPVFFQGYRDMRERGIKFPQIEVCERNKINLCPVMRRSKFHLTGGVTLPLSPQELDSILATVNSLNTLPPGCEHAAALKRLKDSKEKIVASINILAENRAQITDPHNYEEVMRKMLMLNDCVGMHLLVGGTGKSSSTQLLSALEQLRGATTEEPTPQAAPPTPAAKEETKANLLDLESSSDSENEAFDSFFDDKSGGAAKKSDDDYDKFFADFGVFSHSTATSSANRGQPAEGAPADRPKDYFSDLGALNFGQAAETKPASGVPATAGPFAGANTASVSAPSGSSAAVTPRVPAEAGAFSNTTFPDIDLSALDLVARPVSPQPTAELAESSAPASPAISAAPSSAPGSERDSEDEAEEPEEKKESPTEDGKKSLTELMKELDEIDQDFGHMSVSGF
ncbi:hypothetical protein, conserved [Babesia bigemina]|uniref:VHS domain-containing protein n=1 Tax=Babesia bigemina TaxID=5866 RepID=A0A061DAP0_BABBI|nr:hypothetical protein, conserved [Babesia bigemina]CDR95974.1 hypothetical protein, conserved [Babesia bigemina]|eukprot:XP_012768160.1 hypothetical protein, conserved [Babesia bigemina]